MLKAIVPAAIALFTGSALAEANPEFITFALKQAHHVGFNGCDAAIRNAFGTAGGKDIRVWTDWMKETRSDQLQILGAWGNEGDMVTVEVGIRRAGKACLGQASTTVVSDKSCPSYLSDNPAWKVESATGDIMAAKNPGGVTLLLRPVGKNCLLTYRRGFSAQAN